MDISPELAAAAPTMPLSFSDRVNGRVLWALTRLAQHTCRFSQHGWDYVDEQRALGQQFLWATWHPNSMQIVSFMRRYRPERRYVAMIPDDWRGAALYYWFRHVDILPWPMDLEGKGMHTARRFAEMIRFIKKSGADNYISPDGPEGPAFQVKPGLTFIAQKTGLPILPIAAHTRHSYPLNRWDAYRIPFPFAHVHIAVGPPLTIARDEETEGANERLRHALNEVTLRAQAEFYSGDFPPKI